MLEKVRSFLGVGVRVVCVLVPLLTPPSPPSPQFPEDGEDENKNETMKAFRDMLIGQVLDQSRPSGFKKKENIAVVLGFDDFKLNLFQAK